MIFFRFCVCCILLVINKSVLSEDLRDLGLNDLLKLGQDVSQIHPNEVQPSDVQFYLLESSDSDPVLITTDHQDILNNTKKTKFVIHGWLENHKRSWYQNIGAQYLEDDDVNFIEVDWEKPARIPYIYSAKSTRMVGNAIAQFIQDRNLSPKDVHLIGHSLGAHIAGFAGKKLYDDTGEKLQRITALDPAGPYFRLSDNLPSERLDKDDAEIVDAIHTDAGFYGYENPIGTLDIYVNGGQRIQPGCLDEIVSPESLGDFLGNSFCSHARSVKYFAEWVNDRKFVCKFCQPIFGVYLFGDICTFHHTDQVLGSEDVTADVTGVCFTRTNKEEPYLS